MGANFLQDGNGNSSSTRLLGAFVWVAVMTAWLWITFSTKAMPDLPQTILGVLGMTAGWLVFNKHIEVNAPTPPSDKP